MKYSHKKGGKFIIYAITFVLISISFSSCILPDLVESSLIDRLHDCKYITADFNADIQSNNDFLSFSILSSDNIPFDEADDKPLNWDGNEFSCTYDYSYETFSGENVRCYGNITGKLSFDAKTLEDFTIDQTSLHLDSGDVFKNFLTVVDVPYQDDYEYDSYSPRYSAEGEEVSNHIYSYSQSWEFQDSDGKTHTVYSTEVFYNNPDDVPYLYITFSE